MHRVITVAADRSSGRLAGRFTSIRHLLSCHVRDSPRALCEVSPCLRTYKPLGVMLMMTLEEYTAAIRSIASNDGIVTHETYWSPQSWQRAFENGLTPSDAWDHERNPALNAM